MIDGAKQEGLDRADVIDDHDAMAEAVRACASPGSVVLCKGSRGMRMEKVIASLAGDPAIARVAEATTKAGPH